MDKNLITELYEILNYLKISLLVSIVVIGVIIMLPSTSIAYDGDVDFNAPYLTVDPETGKLVTIDPKTQTKTPHVGSGGTSTQATPATDDALTSQTTLMAQASPVESLIEENNVLASGSNTIILIGLFVVLVAFTKILLSYRNRQTLKPEQTQSDSGNSET